MNQSYFKISFLKSLLYRCFEKIEEMLNIGLFYCILKHSPRNHDKQRVLIIKLDHIGDFVLFSSSLKAYRELFPKSILTLLVQDCVFNLAETCPYVDEVWQINQRTFRRNPVNHWSWLKRIHNAKFNICINAVCAVSERYMECLVGVSKANRRIGFACEGRGVKWGRPYYTELVPDVSEGLFEMDKHALMLRYLGYLQNISREPEVWITNEDRATARQLLSHLSCEPYGIIFPGSRHSTKIWPVEKFSQVIQLTQKNVPLHWIICGSFNEYGICNTLESDLINHGIPCSNLSGRTSLREFSAITEHASLYLGNDTMAVHLAAAYRVPAVCILGGGHYGRFYPYPDNQFTTAVINALDCFNCKWECKFETPECISGITIDQVVNNIINAFGMK